MEYKCNYAFQTLFVRNSDKNLFLYNKYTYSRQVSHLCMYIELKKYELVSFVTYWQCDLRYFAVIYSTELTLHSHWYKGKHDNVIYNMTLRDDLSSITV